MDTIPGGAYLDGKTWKNAEGKPLSKEQIAEAKQLFSERAQQRAEQERAALALEAERDPVARSLAAALGPKAPAAKPKAAE